VQVRLRCGASSCAAVDDDSRQLLQLWRQSGLGLLHFYFTISKAKPNFIQNRIFSQCLIVTMPNDGEGVAEPLDASHSQPKNGLKTFSDNSWQNCYNAEPEIGV
jgi:hypothetical protein